MLKFTTPLMPAASAVLALAVCGWAAGGADYGRGPETDPVAILLAAANTSAITT
jgi:hypothetical protein